MKQQDDTQENAEPSELAQSSVAQSASGADSIGRIETAKGGVFVTRTDGTKVKGEDGLEIFQGDAVDTDASGSVGIVFADDSTFSLAEKGSMVIDTMVYDPGAQEGSSAFSVAEGVFTFVSGSIAKTGIDAMVINTPTATIGIRGTSLGGKVTDAKGTTVTLLPDSGAGKAAGDDAGDKGGLKGQQGNDGLDPAGEVVISNSVGSQTISQPYQTTQISSQFSSPTLPVILPASVVNQAYASAISVAPAPRGASAAPAGGSSRGNAGGGNTDGGEQAAATGAEAAANPADGDGTPADAAAAAEGAATTAFNDAIAGGASLDDAMAAATTAAVETTVQAVLAANPEAFGTAASISSIVGAVVNAAMGGLGSSAGDPLDAGKGGDNAVSNQAAQAATQSTALAAIAGQAQAAAQAAVVTNAVALVQSGLMSQGALSELAANINTGQPLGGALGAGLGGVIGVASFGAVFANVLATVVTTVAKSIDDVIAAIIPVGETTVTTNVAGTESHDLVANQNDVFVGGAGNDTLSLYNAAQAGDTFDGSGGADTLSLATAGVGHVFRVTNTETVNLPSVGAGNTALLNIVGAGSTSISGSATGATAVAGDSSDQTLTFNNTFDDSTNSLSLTGGGGADKVTFANGTNVIAAMIGVESVELGSSSTTFNNPLSGVEFSSSAGTANITLAGVGNSISIANGEGGVGTVTGSSGVDALTFTGFGSISSLSGFETVTAASAGANFTLAAGGQSTTVSGTFGAITGGSGNDTVTFGSGGATIGTLNNVEAVVGSGAGSNFTFGTAGGGTTISGIFGAITGEAGEGSNTITFASAGASINSVSGNQMTYVGGSGANTIKFANATNESTLSGTFASITGGSGSDRIVFASAGVTIGSLSAVESVVGGTGTDTITLAAGGQTITALSGVETLIGGSGTDIVTLAAGGQTTIASLVETITGGGGNDTVTLGTAQSSGSIDLNGGTDSLTLADGANTLSVSDTETIIGGSGNDAVTLGSLQSSGTVIDLNGGSDSLTLANGVNTLTVSDTETITGGSGADSITLGAGGQTVAALSGVETLIGSSSADTVTVTGSTAGTLTLGGGADSITISGATGAQTIVYGATGEYGDSVTGFTAGASGDVIDFNVTLSRGTGVNFEALATGGTVGTNTAVVNYTTDISNYTTAGDVATAMNTLGGLATGNKLLFAAGNGTNTRLWQWQDGAGGTSDGTVDAGELTTVADLNSVNNDSMTAANFSGFSNAPVSRNAITGDGTSSGTVGVSTNSVTLNSFTIEAWVKLDTGRTGDSWLFSMEETNDTKNLDFGVRQDGTIWFRDSIASGDWIDLKSAASAVADSTWTHIAVVVDASASGTAATGGSLYVNGAAVTLANDAVGASKTDWAAVTHTSTVTVGTGAFSNFSSVYFKGSIGEARLWDTGLTATTIAAKDDQALTGSDNNLVGYWTFSEGSGTSAADTGTGSANNQSGSTNPDLALTLSGATWTTSGPTLAGSDPLVFDLDGDGVELLGTEAGVLFDVDGDGVGDSVGWAGPDDAVLVSDLDGDGLITGMDEVVSPEFGPSAAAGTSSNSLDALTLLDGNADGVIDAADDIYGMLQLWRDANTDGVTDTGELLSLGELGIESISLAGGGVTFEANGNTVWRNSSFTYDDGSTGEVAEVSFARGGDRFIFESTDKSLSLNDFSGETSFLGAVGDGDKLVLDASALGLSCLIYDEVVWDGTSSNLNLNQTDANVVVLTGAAGSSDAAAAALAAGNGAASNATILFRDSANGGTLTMVHTDDLANDGAETTLATFDGVTDATAVETLTDADFQLQA